MKARFLNDVGAYSCFPFSSALEAGHAASALPGPYKIPAYRYEALSIVTNKVTLGAYRGVGLPIAILVMERLLNLGAQRLELDPAEIRLRNMIRQEDHPYTTIAGAKIESGSHQESLQKALDMLGYDTFRAEQTQGRKAVAISAWALAVTSKARPPALRFSTSWAYRLAAMSRLPSGWMSMGKSPF